jgi:hypothetical protein
MFIFSSLGRLFWGKGFICLLSLLTQLQNLNLEIEDIFWRNGMISVY